MTRLLDFGGEKKQMEGGATFGTWRAEGRCRRAAVRQRSCTAATPIFAKILNTDIPVNTRRKGVNTAKKSVILYIC